MQVLAFQKLLLHSPDGIGLPGCRINSSSALQSTFFGVMRRLVPSDTIAYYLARMHFRARC